MNPPTVPRKALLLWIVLAAGVCMIVFHVLDSAPSNETTLRSPSAFAPTENTSTENCEAVEDTNRVATTAKEDVENGLAADLIPPWVVPPSSEVVSDTAPMMARDLKDWADSAIDRPGTPQHRKAVPYPGVRRFEREDRATGSDATAPGG